MSAPKNQYRAAFGLLLLVTLTGCQRAAENPLIGSWNGDMPEVIATDGIESLSTIRVGFDFHDSEIVSIRRTVVSGGTEKEESETTRWQVLEASLGETLIEITNPGTGEPRTRKLSVIFEDTDTIRIEEPKVIDDAGPIVLHRVNQGVLE